MQENRLNPENKPVVFTFLGDICLSDDYIRMNQQGIHPFDSIRSANKGSDFIIGNLECMAKGNKGENELKKPRFHTTLNTLNYILEIGLNIVFLANNHVSDQLEDGFIRTIEFLEKNHIKHLGAGLSPEEAMLPLIVNRNDISVGLLNFVTPDTHPNLPSGSGIYLNVFSLERCLKEIQDLRSKVDHVVLSLHWGGRVEGGLYPDWDQPGIAHALLDAGADLIIGNHSHTIQPVEIYKGKHIFYSIGNFCFSDYTFDNKKYELPLRKRISLVVTASFAERGKYLIRSDPYRNNFTGYLHDPSYMRKLYFHNQAQRYIFRIYPFWLLYFYYFKHLLPLFLFFRRKDLTYQEKIAGIFSSINKRLQRE